MLPVITLSGGILSIFFSLLSKFYWGIITMVTTKSKNVKVTLTFAEVYKV